MEPSQAKPRDGPEYEPKAEPKAEPRDEWRRLFGVPQILSLYISTRAYTSMYLYCAGKLLSIYRLIGVAETWVMYR